MYKIEVLELYLKHIFAFLFLNSVETQVQLHGHRVFIKQYSRTK